MALTSHSALVPRPRRSVGATSAALATALACLASPAAAFVGTSLPCLRTGSFAGSSAPPVAARSLQFSGLSMGSRTDEWKWDRRLSELEFTIEGGLTPSGLPDLSANPSLQKWVKTQQQLNRKGALRADRMERLSGLLGSDWDKEYTPKSAVGIEVELASARGKMDWAKSQALEALLSQTRAFSGLSQESEGDER
jgi:hypothetical protein